MTKNIKQKAVYIWLFIIMASLFCLNKGLYAFYQFDELPKWIWYLIYILTEVSLLLNLSLYVLLDKDKKYRWSLFICIVIFGFTRYEADVTFLSFSVLSAVIMFGNMLFHSRHNRIELIKYILLLVLIVSHYLNELNIGSKLFIGVMKYICLFSLTSIAILFIRYVFPEQKYIFKELKGDKKFKNYIVPTQAFAISIVFVTIFEIFLYGFIEEYKFDRLRNIQIEVYNQNKDKFHSVVECLNKVSYIPILEFEKNRVAISISDSSITDSLKIIKHFSPYGGYPEIAQFTFDEEPFRINNIDFIDSNFIYISSPDTSFIYKNHWNISSSYQNIDTGIITKILNYLDLDKKELEKIKLQIEEFGCYAIAKDIDGNIYFYSKKLALEYFGYIFVKTVPPKEDYEITLTKIDDSFYWFHFEFCCIDFIGSYYMYRYNI